MTEKKRLFYTTRTIEELEPDVCYGLCNPEKRRICEKEKKCLMRLCGSDEEIIAGFSAWHIKTKRDYEEQKKSVEAWRLENFKKCYGVMFTIKEYRV